MQHFKVIPPPRAVELTKEICERTQELYQLGFDVSIVTETARPPAMRSTYSRVHVQPHFHDLYVPAGTYEKPVIVTFGTNFKDVAEKVTNWAASHKHITVSL